MNDEGQDAPSPHAPVAWIPANGTTPFEAFLEETDTSAFVVLHRGMLLYEGYFNGTSRESIHASMSVAKSFTSTLVGIAIEEGLISSLDDPVTVYLPELLERDIRFADITLRHLITMSSGLRYAGGATPWSDPTTT